MQTLTIQNSELSSLLTTALFTVDPKSTLEQLANVAITLNGTLSAYGTNLEHATRHVLKGYKTTGKPVTALLQAKAGKGLLKSLPKDGKTVIGFDTGKLKIGKISYSFKKENTELPNLAQDQNAVINDTIMAVEDFQAIAKKVAFACSSNEFRVAMMGIQCRYNPKENVITFTATDGHSLASMEVPFGKRDGKVAKLPFCYIVKPEVFSFAAKHFDGSKELKVSFIGTSTKVEVPAKPAVVCSECKKTVKEPAQKAGTKIVTVANFIKITDGTKEIISRLIDEQYPNWEAVVPRENEKIVTIDRKNFISVLKEAVAVADKNTHQVCWQLGKDQIIVTSNDAESGNEFSDTVKCSYSHDELVIGFNGKFLLSNLNAIDSDTVQIKLSTPTRAAIFSPVRGEDYEGTYFSLTMPVRLKA